MFLVLLRLSVRTINTVLNINAGEPADVKLPGRFTTIHVQSGDVYIDLKIYCPKTYFELPGPSDTSLRSILPLVAWIETLVEY